MINRINGSYAGSRSGGDWARGRLAPGTQEDLMTDTSPLPPERGSDAGEVFPPEPDETGSPLPPE